MSPTTSLRPITCPANDRGPQPYAFPAGRPDIVGCGSTNLTCTDGEGIIDCGDCGIWFNPADEAYTVEEIDAHNATHDATFPEGVRSYADKRPEGVGLAPRVA